VQAGNAAAITTLGIAQVEAREKRVMLKWFSECRPRVRVQGDTIASTATFADRGAGKKHADDAVQRDSSVYITRWYHQSRTIL
jgi:hypothetical protein